MIKIWLNILFLIHGGLTGNFQAPDEQDSNLYRLYPQPTILDLFHQLHVPTLSEHGPGEDQDPQSWLLSANDSSHTKRCEEILIILLPNMKTSYSCVEFLPYSFEALGLKHPACLCLAAKTWSSRILQCPSFLPVVYCKGAHFENGSLLGEAQQGHVQVQDGDYEAW